MIKHTDGGVTLSREEWKAIQSLSATFALIIPHLEAIFKLLDREEEKIPENDSLFDVERVN